MTIDTLHRRLSALIGERFHYAGETWLLVDVLPDVDALALRSVSPRPGPVQADLYGTPARRSQETLTLPISAADGGYSAELEELLRGRISP